MSIFSITVIVAVILFIREEILSSYYRKELKRVSEEYEAYRRALLLEQREQDLLLEKPGERVLLSSGCAARSEHFDKGQRDAA